MKKVAILIDSGFLNKSILPKDKTRDIPTILGYCDKLIEKDNEEIFRIFYYDSQPLAATKPKPVTKENLDFSKTPVYVRNIRFLEALARKPLIALRLGELKFRGWRLKTKRDSTGNFIGTAIDDVMRRWKDDQNRKNKKLTDYIQDDDFEPDIQQKRVDIKIGLDVAWLASKKIVDRIILLSGDTDFVPVLKFARKEGLQVFIGTCSKYKLQPELLKHSDGVRNIKC